MMVLMVLAPERTDVAESLEVRSTRRAARMAEVAGLLNKLNAELVDLVAEAVTDTVDLDGYASAVQFVAHRTGSSQGRARTITTIAARLAELPVSVSAFRDGRLSIDQMDAIARRVPASHDEQACELALSAMPAALSRVFSRYPWPVPPAEDAPPEETEEPAAKPAAEEAEVREADVQESTTTAYWDDDGAYLLRARLSPDDGALVDTALAAHRDALINQWRRDKKVAADNEVSFTTPMPSWADALVRMADRSLSADAVDRPHHRRHQILLHLDADTHHAHLHLGPAVSAGMRRLMTCDATYRVLYERDGVPLSIGRASHTIPDRTRTIVEDRDGGCRAPACGNRHVQIHHVHHWEHGGPTDTANLIALCPAHHRMHHTGRLGITGTNADNPDGITFHRPDGRVIPGVTPPTPGERPLEPPDTPYQHPEHGRIDPRWVTFHPGTTPPANTS